MVTMTGMFDDPVDPVERLPLPSAIVRGRVVGIGRRLDPATVPGVAATLVDCGIHAFEVTLDSTGGLEVITDLVRRFGPDDLLVGAGTVTTVAAARAAAEAGAGFIVTPVCHLGVIRWAADHGVPVVPGAFTPTEILAAWRAGASAVKLFPASALGVEFVRDVRGPMPEIPLIPTGGITLENAASFIAAGATAVGLGSWLTGSSDIELVRRRATSLVAALATSAAPAAPAAPGR